MWVLTDIVGNGTQIAYCPLIFWLGGTIGYTMLVTQLLIGWGSVNCCSFGIPFPVRLWAAQVSTVSNVLGCVYTTQHFGSSSSALSWQNTEPSGIWIFYLITLSFLFHSFSILMFYFSLKPIHKDQAGRICSVAVNQWPEKIQNVNT